MKRKRLDLYVLILIVLGLCAAVPVAAQMDIKQTLSDGAQRCTIAFDGFAFITGTFEAQTFFPPGKVADYWGFQYLRDNTADGNGHNTSFLTNCAFNVLYILSADQLTMLKTLAASQVDQINLYAYKRFPLMKAFYRQLQGDIPTGSTGLSLDAVKAASADLYELDGQISFDRAVVYAAIFRTLTTSQKSYLATMKAGGFANWTVTTEMETTVRELMKGVSHDVSVALMTYAGDLFSWYAGSIEADVYFCPERQGTYYGSFYVKDAPAIGHEGYKIDEALTASAGQYFLDQLAANGLDSLVTDLVETQRNNLYAGSENIVQIRTDIATLLRSLITTSALSESFKAQVLAQVLDKSEIYGELDGENVYAYTMAFAEIYPDMTTDQQTNLTAMRKKILSGTYNGTAFDFSVCTTPFLYSAIIENTSILDPYISDTDWLFGSSTENKLAVTPSSRSVTKDAGTTTFSVSNAGTGTMTWTAAVTSGSTWVSISSGASGSNSGTITCAYSANTTSASRTATIRVTAADATGSPVDVTIAQAAGQILTIKATAGAGGIISPSGTVSVAYGANVSFTIKPNTGYSVSGVTVDGAAVTTVAAAGGTYTFSNVTQSHTINAVFKPQPITITTSAGAGGTISPSGAVIVGYGTNKVFDIRPNPGYSVSSVKVDGATVTSVPSGGGKYTFSNITQAHTLVASFKKRT